MRHLKAGKRLGVTTSHRKAMMRNLVTSLLEHGEIKTTVTKAKEMRKYFDKMIGLGKKNNLHARRQALDFIKSKEVVNKLFEEYGPLYADRSGGYTRIYKIGRRLGDNAQMALIQMVDLQEEAKPEEKASKERIEEIKEELQESDTEPKVEAEKSSEQVKQEEEAETETVEEPTPEASEEQKAASAEDEAESSDDDKTEQAEKDKEKEASSE
jgi:large subunit ribosomal protein L17